MAKMIHADPVFVRCIRPNAENIPGKFDQEKVMTQLKYTGVLETSKIRKQVVYSDNHILKHLACLFNIPDCTVTQIQMS